MDADERNTSEIVVTLEAGQERRDVNARVGLVDYLDVDGNVLITNDPYLGVTTDQGVLSFADAPEKLGLRVAPRASTA